MLNENEIVTHMQLFREAPWPYTEFLFGKGTPLGDEERLQLIGPICRAMDIFPAMHKGSNVCDAISSVLLEQAKNDPNALNAVLKLYGVTVLPYREYSQLAASEVLEAIYKTLADNPHARDQATEYAFRVYHKFSTYDRVTVLSVVSAEYGINPAVFSDIAGSYADGSKMMISSPDIFPRSDIAKGKKGGFVFARWDPKFAGWNPKDQKTTYTAEYENISEDNATELWDRRSPVFSTHHTDKGSLITALSQKGILEAERPLLDFVERAESIFAQLELPDFASQAMQRIRTANAMLHRDHTVAAIRASEPKATEKPVSQALFQDAQDIWKRLKQSKFEWAEQYKDIPITAVVETAQIAGPFAELWARCAQVLLARGDEPKSSIIRAARFAEAIVDKENGVASGILAIAMYELSYKWKLASQLVGITEDDLRAEGKRFSTQGPLCKELQPDDTLSVLMQAMEEGSVDKDSRRTLLANCRALYTPRT